ncbi:hypothetical protein Tco_0930569 [Tanacetum coccineum]
MERHEEQIEEILNHLDELSLDRIEHIEDKIEGLGKGRVIIQQDFDNLEAELRESHTQIAKLQRKQMGNNNKISLARFRIANLEQIIEDIQVRHQADKESLLNAIYEHKNSQEGPSDYWIRYWLMPPQRTSTFEAPAMTQDAIKKLVADTIGLIQWFERTESVFSHSNCIEDCKVKFATSTLTEEALSWWNSFAQPIGIEEAYKITWVEFKKLLIKKYYPRTEELATLCPTMVPDSEKMMEVFIEGLPRSIEGNVTTSKPKTLEEPTNIAQRLMDQLRTVGMLETSHYVEDVFCITQDLGLSSAILATRWVISPGTTENKDQLLEAISNQYRFDVVIGMDWLSKYHATIIFDEKFVHILINGETLIIREVFPKDLPGLPPVRQVKFQIDLIPRTTSVAHAPYRLAPSEMQEVSNQLQELADRGPEIIHETTEKIVQIRQRLQAARDRQRSYANVRRKPLEFQVGDRVMLKVSPLAYKLELLEELNNVHSTFHVSNLKKCLSNESLVIPMKELQLDDKLNFVEERVEIIDREVKQLKQSRIPIVKVRWNSKRGQEFTWEREDQIRAKYPHLFSNITPASN